MVGLPRTLQTLRREAVSPTYSREAVSRMEIMTPRYLVVYGTPMGIMKIDDCG